MLDLTCCSPKYSVICGTRRQVKPCNKHYRNYPPMLACKRTFGCTDAIHHSETVEFYCNIIVAAEVLESGMHKIDKNIGVD
jgi:hypothetical protein